MTVSLAWLWLGRVDYEDALAEQHRRRARILGGDAAASAILLCEHSPVITLGRSASEADVRASSAQLQQLGVAVVRVERGGNVTFHGPGQLMIYTVVRARRGIVWLLATVGAEIAAVCAELGVKDAAFRRGQAGVWVDGRKIAACGLHLHRGVVTHGFALDVSTEPQLWSLVNPCGLGEPGTSLAAEIQRQGGSSVPSVAEIAKRVGPRLAASLV